MPWFAGAPAIAIVGALSLAVEIWRRFLAPSEVETVAEALDAAHVLDYISSRLEYLKTSRPTAVNLADAAGKLWNAVVSESNKSHAADGTLSSTVTPLTPDAKAILTLYVESAEAMLADDISDNRAIGKFGADFILDGSAAALARGQGKMEQSEVAVLTHCNTGSLATAGWVSQKGSFAHVAEYADHCMPAAQGTALGVVRDLNLTGKLAHCYCTETRPYNQGSRLTAYELVHEKIPSTLVTDSMVSSLLASRPIAAIVVGADRVAANGDTANKIGTYQLAITAKYHGVPFLVAAPSTSVDLNTPSGDKIVVEQRPGVEVTLIRGKTIDDEAGMKEPPTTIVEEVHHGGSRSGSPQAPEFVKSGSVIERSATEGKGEEDEEMDSSESESRDEDGAGNGEAKEGSPVIETLMGRIGHAVTHALEGFEGLVNGQHGHAESGAGKVEDSKIVGDEITTCTVRIAAEGIGVWNPSFDVTPAELITAIITEKGVVTKASGSKVFDMAGFLGSK